VPDVRPAEDPARDDLEIRVWGWGNAFAHERSSLDRFAAILPLMSSGGHPAVAMVASPAGVTCQDHRRSPKWMRSFRR
jgi:hypothetical protein